jgi:translation initiation factor IF-2
MKVFELAKELDIGAIDLVEKLKSMGMNVRNHMVKLSDEDVEKAREALAAKAPAAKKTTKKKVVKKATKKKVAKKASASGEKVAKKTTKKKVVTVKRKAKTLKKKAASEEADVQTKAEAAPVEDKKEYLDNKDSLHTFTPVSMPESQPKEESNDSKDKPKKVFTKPTAANAPKTEDDDEHSKKRLGGLAAMVNKKSQGRAQDLTQIRAEEEMKLASVVVGRTVYTPAKRKKVYTGATKQTEITEVKESKRVVNLHDGATAEELAGKLSQKFEVFANNALKLNLLVKKDDYLGIGLATQLAAQYNYRVENVAFKEDTILKKKRSRSLIFHFVTRLSQSWVTLIMERQRF